MDNPVTRNNTASDSLHPAVRYGVFALMIIAVSVGDGLAMKAGIGTTAYEAFSLTLSYLTSFKVGTLAMCFNVTMILLQLILSRRFNFRTLLQIPVVIVQGQVLNFIVYVFLGKVVMRNYAMRLAFLLGGFTVSACSIGILMALDVIVFPLEGFCYALSEKIPVSFPKVRQAADAICIILALILTFLFRLELTIREGSVIGMLIFSPIMGFSMNWFKKHVMHLPKV